MSYELLCTTITCISVWVSTVIIIVLYIRLRWSGKIALLERIIKEMDWRLATTEAKFIRTQEDLREIRKHGYSILELEEKECPSNKSGD